MDFSSPVTSALLENITGTAAANVAKEVRCEVCRISVSSYVSNILLFVYVSSLIDIEFFLALCRLFCLITALAGKIVIELNWVLRMKRASISECTLYST
jgi:hypothetical protein